MNFKNQADGSARRLAAECFARSFEPGAVRSAFGLLGGGGLGGCRCGGGVRIDWFCWRAGRRRGGRNFLSRYGAGEFHRERFPDEFYRTIFSGGKESIGGFKDHAFGFDTEIARDDFLIGIGNHHAGGR